MRPYLETVIAVIIKMKSHLIRVGLVNYDWCFYKKRKRDKETEMEKKEECQAKLKNVQLQIKECQGLPSTIKN